MKSRNGNAGSNRALLETLEHRRFLTTVYWDGGGDGVNWDSSENWSTNHIPMPDEDVVINIPDAQVVMGAYGNVTTAKSITLGNPSGGTVSLTLDLAVCSIESFDILTTGVLELRGTGLGCAPAMQSNNAGTIILRQSHVAGFVVNTGTIESHQIEGQSDGVDFIDNFGSIKLYGRANFLGGAFGANIINHGTIDFLGVAPVGFRTRLSGQILNTPIGVIDVSPGGERQIVSQIDNAGVINVQAPLSIDQLAGLSTNSGTINVTLGELLVTQFGFINTGNIAIGAGRKATFEVLTSFEQNGVISGSGTIRFGFGQVNLATDLSNATTDVELASCWVNGPGSLISAPGKTMKFEAVEVNASLVNQGRLDFSGYCRINAPFTLGAGALVLVNDGNLALPNGLTNNGTIQLQNALLDVSGGPLVNPVGRTILITGIGATLNGAISNAGLIDVDAPTGFFPTTFSNSGTINVQGGNLQITGVNPALTNSGTIHVAASRQLIVPAGMENMNGGRIDGRGIVVGNLTNSGTVAPGDPQGAVNISGHYTSSPTGRLEAAFAITANGVQLDRLIVSGTTTLAGTLSLQTDGSSLPQQTFTLIQNNGATAVVGTFAALPEGGTTSIGGRLLRISYVGGDGNDVTLRPVPSDFRSKFALRKALPIQTDAQAPGSFGDSLIREVGESLIS